MALLEDDRTDFAQEERLGLPCWTMISAICVLVDASTYLDILTLELSINNDGASYILTRVLADTASAACPAHPGSLAMTLTQMNLAL